MNLFRNKTEIFIIQKMIADSENRLGPFSVQKYFDEEMLKIHSKMAEALTFLLAENQPGFLE